DRGHTDHVGTRYEEMAKEGSLRTLGDQTVPIREWIQETLAFVDGSPIEAVCADRFKKAEMCEALAAEQCRARLVLSGMGWRDGSESVRRFQRYALNQRL